MSLFQKSVERFEKEKKFEEERLSRMLNMTLAVEAFEETKENHLNDLAEALSRKGEFTIYKLHEGKLEVEEKHKKGEKGKLHFILKIDPDRKEFIYEKHEISYCYVTTSGSYQKNRPDILEEKKHDITFSNPKEIQQLTEKYLVKMVDEALRIK